MKAPSAPEFSEVSRYPFLPCEFFFKGSLYISEDAFIATVLHDQQMRLLELQECLLSSLQPSREVSLLGGADLGSAPAVSSADPSRGDLAQGKAAPRVSVSRCSQALALPCLLGGQESWQRCPAAAARIAALPEHCQLLVNGRKKEQQLPGPIQRILKRMG